MNKNINYQLWLVLMLTSFIPLIYATTRIYFLGSIESPWAYSIAAQVAWLNVGYEVLHEALFIPLSFIFGKVVSDDRKFQERVSLGLKIIVISYFLVTAVVLWFTPIFVTAMQQQKELFTTTVQYIRLESLAILLSSVYAFLSLVLVLKNQKKTLYKLLVVQMILTILCDALFVSQLPISFELGVHGIAFSNIIVNLIIAAVAITYLIRLGVSLKFGQSNRNKNIWLKEWVVIGWKSGLESFVRNAAFIVMILQLVNQVQQAGTFWVANQFIWGWLLLPILALGQLVKQDAATNKGLSIERINGYFWLTVGVIVAWAITIPMWDGFISSVMGVKSSGPIIDLVWLLVGFYVVFSFNNVIDSYFYGIGRTDLMLYQSLVVNSVFYGGAFVCYQAGIFVPTLQTIGLMFGLGITLDAMITWALYLMLRRQQSLSQCESLLS
ncbi:MATE family Na+-driven efflux transporter [Vibrio splendidus]|jgi:Na+-driven multidrug efflux pump|uniref:MATE family Na+-driven efflux transporter n=1 Tax=Vibrio splendidus TaxID=29497 RepID=UPI000C8246FD|nr:MATE family Na+-driven efflux transporter [Vibrio splendidus]MBT9239758.1 multidrug transporter [Vibrio splendidus]MDP2616833.1 multidrug transporter [Vibrio splendidus]PMK07806.1 multidrug transporter [Vibrio splendidus]URM13387.1 multidrug transporter [Vibrio splendidus]